VRLSPQILFPLLPLTTPHPSPTPDSPRASCLRPTAACRSCAAADKQGKGTFFVSYRTPGLVYVVDTRQNTIWAYTFNASLAGQMSSSVSAPVTRAVFAGGNTQTVGDVGDGGLANASTVRLSSPIFVTEDPATGDVYINDYGNSKIRHVSASTGIMTTYASTSFMRFPRSLTVDGSGTLYVGDVGARPKNASTSVSSEYFITLGSERGAIYSVSSAGVYTLVAGGGAASAAASSAQVQASTVRMVPYKIQYVAVRNAIAWLDPVNNLVKEFSLTSGNVRNLVGTWTTTNSGGTSSQTPRMGRRAAGHVNAEGSIFCAWGGPNIPPTSAFAAGFGVSQDGENIVVGARNWIVAASHVAGATANDNNAGVYTHTANVYRDTYPAGAVMNVDLVEDVQPDYDGTGIFYMQYDAPGNVWQLRLTWTRSSTPDGSTSNDGSGWGKGTPCPVGFFTSGNSGRCTNYGPKWYYTGFVRASIKKKNKRGLSSVVAHPVLPLHPPLTLLPISLPPPTPPPSPNHNVQVACYAGPLSCLPCTAGYTTSGTGSTSCTGCPEGLSSNSGGSCFPCPLNTYAPSSGSLNTAGTTTGSCTTCLAGRDTRGATGVFFRTSLSGPACTSCLDGSSTINLGDNCTVCPAGTQSDREFGGVSLPVGS
jgi:hypothetical protein